MRDLLQGVSSAGSFLRSEQSNAGSMPGLEKGDGTSAVPEPAADAPKPRDDFISKLQQEVSAREAQKMAFVNESKVRTRPLFVCVCCVSVSVCVSMRGAAFVMTAIGH